MNTPAQVIRIPADPDRYAYSFGGGSPVATVEPGSVVELATEDCFGGLVDMPAMRRIADRGVRLSQFHTTALCSPTRASLLTGRSTIWN